MPKLDQIRNKTLAEAPTLGNLHPDARAQAIARGSREDALIAALRTHDGDAPDGWQFGLGLVKFDAHGQFADFRWATQADIDAAIQRATPQAQPERKPMTREQCEWLLRQCGVLANFDTLDGIVRAVERHHGIGVKP